MSDSLRPLGLYSPWNSPGHNTGVGYPFPFPGDLSNPGVEPRSPALQADSLTNEPPGKPKNTGVGSLSLLWWIFLTQESNWGLLHYRQILYQLSYYGSPIIDNSISKTNEVQLLIRPKKGGKKKCWENKLQSNAGRLKPFRSPIYVEMKTNCLNFFSAKVYSIPIYVQCSDLY